MDNTNKDLREQLAATQLQLGASQRVTEEIAQYLNFNLNHLSQCDQPVSWLHGRLKEEIESSVYLQLRMGLSAALMALDKASGLGTSNEQKVVIDALYIEEIRKGLGKLLARMEEFSGSQLWDAGLFLGFSQNWLHYLLRADLILRAYFAKQKGVGFLQEAISLASSAVKAALLELDVGLVRIELFEPLQTGVEPVEIHYNLRKLPVVQNLIQERLSKGNNLFVVDVISFPIRLNGKQIISGRAAVVNPSDWMQNL